jgi:putative transposase
VATIDYLKAENRMLRARLGGRRIVFSDAERRQLAEKARALGREALHELGTIITPETLLRWHRELVARKWNWSGLMTYYVLFVMELATRRVCIAGITTHPDEQWMLQMARQLTDGVDGILLNKRYLILDRDTKYCQAFRDFLKREGIEVIRLPPRSPNLNAHAERWVRGVRDECLSRLIPIGQGMLRRTLREYGAHFHQERNHQGLGSVLITPDACSTHQGRSVICRPRLGGLLNFYERTAA